MLVYKYEEATRGQSDIIGVEQINGKATLLYGRARTAVSEISMNKYLVNGRWFKVTGTRNKRVASLNVQNYTEYGECCKQSLAQIHLHCWSLYLLKCPFHRHYIVTNWDVSLEFLGHIS